MSFTATSALGETCETSAYPPFRRCGGVRLISHQLGARRRFHRCSLTATLLKDVRALNRCLLTPSSADSLEPPSGSAPSQRGAIPPLQPLRDSGSPDAPYRPAAGPPSSQK